jgi:uncharacterized membrane protein
MSVISYLHDTGPALFPPGRRRSLALLAILAIALGLRAWDLGQLSFWYDEVVTMRLAETPGPGDLVEKLFQIDATRAPLHPLLLQAWLRLFGTSEAAARALSVLCGVVAVGLVDWIGRLAFDSRTGLWSAWLAAVSPLLVYYSREARMYAWLVMVTCLCWGLLFSLRRVASREGEAPAERSCTPPSPGCEPSRSPARREPRPPGVSRIALATAYSLGIAALLYSHPLGMIMAGTLALAALLGFRSFFGTPRGWLAAHLGALILAAPWLRHYFDHSPEFLSGRLPIKFLLGTPIGFIGGNSLVLLAVVALMVLGIARRRGAFQRWDDWAGPVCLMLWLILPPVLLYGYSMVGSPIFGPARYTLFVAPAYLILTAQGLAALPPRARYVVAFGLLLVAIPALRSTVYAPGLKADWRAFSAVLEERMREDPAAEVIVAVNSDNPDHNVEVETARYYLPARCKVVGLDETNFINMNKFTILYLCVAIGNKDGSATLPSPDASSSGWAPDGPYPGLAVYRAKGPPPANPSRSRKSAASALPGPG